MKDELFIHSVLGSASAGIIARVLCHPIDTCKSKIQYSDSKLLSGYTLYYIPHCMYHKVSSKRLNMHDILVCDSKSMGYRNPRCSYYHDKERRYSRILPRDWSRSGRRRSRHRDIYFNL